MLEPYAQAATQHTANELPSLAPLTLQSLDAVLRQIRVTLVADQLESLAICYGAFLAQELIGQGGRWGNTETSVAPRIDLDGMWVSPIDEVRRRLLGSPTQPLVDMIATANSPEKILPDEVLKQENAEAWNARANDPRWAPPTPPRLTVEQATEVIDPWLRPSDTFDGIVGKKILCIAAAGGTHGPLHAMAGAEVTVLDVSEAMLGLDRKAASELGVQLIAVAGCMTELEFANNSFDCVIQPVSSCYTRSLNKMYRGIARVLRPGGVYLVQHKTPAALQVAYDVELGKYTWIHRSGDRVPPNSPVLNHEAGTLEFSHSVAAIFGGLCQAGFTIEAVDQPVHSDAWAPAGSIEHFAQFAEPYLKIRATKRES